MQPIEKAILGISGHFYFFPTIKFTGLQIPKK